MCEIPEQFAKHYRTKETEQYSKCGEKGHLDRACKRQRDGGKHHESVAMGTTMATPDDEYRAALTPWKTAGVLVDSGRTYHIVTNTNTFLDIVKFQSLVRNPNGEAVSGGQRLCEDQHTLKQRRIQMRFKERFVCA